MLSALVAMFLLACDTQEPPAEACIAPTIEAWHDFDVDGVGGGDPELICSWDDAEPTMVPMGGDCDDGRWDVAPGYLDDDCDGVDNDCNGVADDAAEQLTIYLDADGDTYGSDGTTSPMATLSGCDPWATVDDPGQWAQRGGDCDDTNMAIRPMRLDPSGDGVDVNCDGDPDR